MTHPQSWGSYSGSDKRQSICPPFVYNESRWKSGSSFFFFFFPLPRHRWARPRGSYTPIQSAVILIESGDSMGPPTGGDRQGHVVELRSAFLPCFKDGSLRLPDLQEELGKKQLSFLCILSTAPNY